jgi:hypothetical protein
MGITLPEFRFKTSFSFSGCLFHEPLGVSPELTSPENDGILANANGERQLCISC